jgi:hypothetical protein
MVVAPAIAHLQFDVTWLRDKPHLPALFVV